MQYFARGVFILYAVTEIGNFSTFLKIHKILSKLTDYDINHAFNNIGG